MTDLRRLRVEIETDNKQPDDHLPTALADLAETIGHRQRRGYRVVITEDRDVIFTSQDGSCDE